jgi:hypothetical protein
MNILISIKSIYSIWNILFIKFISSINSFYIWIIIWICVFSSFNCIINFLYLFCLLLQRSSSHYTIQLYQRDRDINCGSNLVCFLNNFYEPFLIIKFSLFLNWSINLIKHFVMALPLRDKINSNTLSTNKKSRYIKIWSIWFTHQCLVLSYTMLQWIPK